MILMHCLKIVCLNYNSLCFKLNKVKAYSSILLFYYNHKQEIYIDQECILKVYILNVMYESVGKVQLNSKWATTGVYDCKNKAI